MKFERTECYQGVAMCLPCEMGHASLGNIHTVLCGMECPENNNPTSLEWDIITGNGNVVPNSLHIALSEICQKKEH